MIENFTNFTEGIKNRWFLNEERLGNYLTKLFPKYRFEHDKCVSGSGIPHRADYQNSELKLIVEFDGYQHFTQTKRIIADMVKDTVYSELGYTVIHIPYFIQVSPKVIDFLFAEYFDGRADLTNFETKFKQIYPHGFVDDSAYMVLPADFCEFGIVSFMKSLENFDFIADEIYKSLKIKYQQCLVKNAKMSMLTPDFLKYLIVPNNFVWIFEEESFCDVDGNRLPTNQQLTAFIAQLLGGLCDEHLKEYLSEFEGKIINSFNVSVGERELEVPTFTIVGSKIKILDPAADYSENKNTICSCTFFKREHSCGVDYSKYN